MRPTWIVALVIVVLAAGIAVYSVDSTGSMASNSGISTPSDNSSSLGSSVSSSSFAVQSSSVSSSSSLNQSAFQYPLVWAPKPVGVGCDYFPFCIEAVLGFAGHTETSNLTSTATIVVQDNTTTIVFESTTTYMSGVSTGVVYPPDNAAIVVSVWAFVQDAVTGQNVTTDSGQYYVGGGCGIQPTGFTDCYAGAGVPPGHTYKVTVYVTKGDLLPCSIRPAGANFACTSQLLAPIQTVTVTE